LLAGKLMKDQNMFEQVKLQTFAKRFDEIATSKDIWFNRF